MLLEGATGGRVLCDGGMGHSMKAHVRERLSALHNNSQHLDVVYVSHIDADHIEGILQLLLDLSEWRAVESHPDNSGVNRPRVPRPPNIHHLWHNGLHDYISHHDGAIGDVVAARASVRRIEALLRERAPVFYGTGVDAGRRLAHDMFNIASSIPQSLRVSALAKPEILGIKQNEPSQGKLMLIEDVNAPIDVGSLRFHIIGPTKSQLRQLRKGWDQWLREDRLGKDGKKGKKEAAEIRREMRRRADRIANGDLSQSPYDLHDWNGVPDFEGVTVPNTASLMFLVEDGDKTLLLTGDSHHDLILEGLYRTGQLGNTNDPKPSEDSTVKLEEVLEDKHHLHVNVLKVPHHGASHNASIDFCRRISADHYVFCGDGQHGNPEEDVLRMYYESRLGANEVRALSPQAKDRDFHFWFSTDASMVGGAKAKKTFASRQTVVNNLVNASNGRLEVHFNTGASTALVV